MSYYSDKQLKALHEAVEAWDSSQRENKHGKLRLASNLHKHGVFSLPQIAKIVRLNPRYIYDALAPNNTKPGGRFDPATLSALVRVCQSHLLGDRITPALIRTVINGGTSYSCAVHLTGIPYSTYYAESSKTQAYLDARPEKNMKFRPKQSPAFDAEAQKMRRSGMTVAAISTALGVGWGTVNRALERENA